MKSKLLVINEVLVDRYHIPIHSSLRRNYNSSQNVAKFVNTSQVEKIHIFKNVFTLKSSLLYFCRLKYEIRKIKKYLVYLCNLFFFVKSKREPFNS